MDCAKARELLPAHIDGELEPAEEQELQAHVAECASCGRELRLLRLTQRAVASLDRARPALDLSERVLARTHPRRMRRPVFRWYAAAAACASLVMFALLLTPMLTSTKMASAPMPQIAQGSQAKYEDSKAMPAGAPGARGAVTEKAAASKAKEEVAPGLQVEGAPASAGLRTEYQGRAHDLQSQSLRAPAATVGSGGAPAAANQIPPPAAEPAAAERAIMAKRPVSPAPTPIGQTVFGDEAPWAAWVLAGAAALLLAAAIVLLALGRRRRPPTHD